MTTSVTVKHLATASHVKLSVIIERIVSDGNRTHVLIKLEKNIGS